MPLSTNAPFSEFGQSMILRDIEQLYLSLNAAGSGSSGDGATQDQAQDVSQDSGEGGLSVDLSGLATTEYVNQVAQDIIDSIPAMPSDALSVVGNPTNASGSVSAIIASVDNTVLGRRGAAITFDKVARSEMSDGSACSVVGRSANTSGAVADITAGNGTLLCRRDTSNTVSFSTDPIISRDSQSLSLCMIATITTSTTAPTRSATKGELYIVY